MDMEKVKAAFADEAFAKALFEMETAAEVQAALGEKGVEVTEAEILSVRDILLKMDAGEINPEQLQQMEEGELSDAMLELVAGGGLLAAIAGVLAFLGGTGVHLGTRGSW